MSLHLDTLFWFQTNKSKYSFILLLYEFVEKQHIPILYSLVLADETRIHDLMLLRQGH